VTATAFDDRVDDGAALSGVGVADKKPVLLPKSGWADRILNEVCVDLDAGLFEINLQRFPLSQGIAWPNCTPATATLFRNKTTLSSGTSKSGSSSGRYSFCRRNDLAQRPRR